MPFVPAVERRAAVEVRRCYCVVNESEFAVPPREQLQTRCVHPGLRGRSHLLAESGNELEGNKYVVRDHTAGGFGRGGRESAGYRVDLERPERSRCSPNDGVVPAAADEVSALTAAQFAAHAQMYQAVSAQAQAIHEAFVNTLSTSSGSYAATEAANAAAAG